MATARGVEGWVLHRTLAPPCTLWLPCVSPLSEVQCRLLAVIAGPWLLVSPEVEKYLSCSCPYQKYYFKENLEKPHIFKENWQWVHSFVEMKIVLCNDHGNLLQDPWMEMSPNVLVLWGISWMASGWQRHSQLSGNRARLGHQANSGSVFFIINSSKNL